MAPPSGVKPAFDAQLDALIFETDLQAPVFKSPKPLESNFDIQSLTLNASLFTDEFRDTFEASTLLPKGLFLGPLTTDITLTGRLDFGYRNPARGPSFFASLGGGHFRTDAALHADGSFYQVGLGIVKREAPTKRWGNEKYSFDIGGGTTAFGVGLSFYQYDSIDGSSVVRIDFIDDSSIASVRFDGFTLGMKIFAGHQGINFGGSDIAGCEGQFCSTADYVPGSWTEAMSFSLSYDFGESLPLDENRKSLNPGEVYSIIGDLAVQRFRAQSLLQGVTQLVDTRVLLEAGVQGSVGSQDNAANARLGMSFFQTKQAWGMGDLAWDLKEALSLANSTERRLILGAEAVTTLSLGLHAFVDAGEEGAPGNFSQRASRLLFYQNLEAQALGILGGYDLLGDPHGKNSEKILFWTTHGAMAAVGVLGTVLYWQPFGKDPDSIAFNGGEGIIDPNELNQDMENRFLWTGLLATSGFYALNAILAVEDVPVGAAPVPGGGVVGAKGEF